MTYEAYTVLEVEPQASIETIKQNYARLCRKYYINKNEEKLNSVLQAHEILVDNPQIKEIYDALQFVGELWKAYEKKYSQRAWEEAIETLMQISVEKPDNDEIENLISVLHRSTYDIIRPIWEEWEKIKSSVHIQHKFGLCYTHTRQWSKAIEAYEELIERRDEWKPEDSIIYWMGFGQVYTHQAEYFPNSGISQLRLYQQARECFKQAIDLEPSNSVSYLSTARTYLRENNYSEAATWAEKAIEADGKLDFDDFEAFHFLCIVYANSRNFQKIHETALKIKPLLPNQEKRSHASSKFIEYADECYQEAAKQCDFLEEIDSYTQIDLFKTSIAFLKVAAELSSNNEKVEEKYRKIENLICALNQFQTFRNDSLIPASYKKIVVISFFDYIEISNSDDETERFLNSLIVEIAASPEISFTKLTDRLSTQYPEIYNLNKKIFYRFAQGLSKHQIDVLVNKSELFSGNTYQGFIEAIKNRYFQNPDALREEVNYAKDRLYTLLEPITEKIVEKYEEAQFNSDNFLNTSSYQSFVEMIRSRAVADSTLVRKGISFVARRLYDFLDPLAEKVLYKYPNSQQFLSPVLEKLFDLSQEID